MRGRSYILWACILSGWILIGLSWTLNYYIFAGQYVAIFTIPPSLGQMMLWELPYWVIWAALAPVIYKLTKRFPPEGPRWGRNVTVHVATCFLLSVGHRGIYLILGWALNVVQYHRLASLDNLYHLLFLFNLPTGFMSYATILLVSYVIIYQRRYQQEELKASQLEARLAQAELQAANARLGALKMQLQPHFLFNTLNSISALMEDNVEAADRMLTRMSNLLRRTLESSSVDTVTLSEELEFVRCYLDIERVRLEDRLAVEFDFPPETLSAAVPNLILQPVVENAIKHAIAPSECGGKIRIGATIRQGRLLLAVTDSGCVIDGKQVGPGDSRNGVGLSNTRARLAQHYGKDQSLQMAHLDDGGFRVSIEIPFSAGAVSSAARLAIP
ncbi:MAG TPA: histidine kinase [Blastocatellia bacterium]